MMPSPATEIAIFPVLVGANLEDPNSPTGKVWHSVLDTVSSQEGFQRAYFGREVEDQSMVQLLIGKLQMCIFHPLEHCSFLAM